MCFIRMLALAGILLLPTNARAQTIRGLAVAESTRVPIAGAQLVLIALDVMALLARVV